MITPELHRQPVPLDREKHRQTVLRLPLTDWSRMAGMNALFLTAAECAHAARDYPIVFIKAGQNEQGQADYAPVAVFGLSTGENLYVDGTQWRGVYVPSLMGFYPLCVARLEANRYAVCIDESCEAVSADGPGERLFDDQGKPTEFTQRVQADLERLETLVDQTRAVCRRLVELDLLVEKRFDATPPDGQKLTVNGFFTVDDARVQALPDATVLALHREGLLAVIHAHWVSMGHMRRLLDWHLVRHRKT
ncbi:MAG: SapC family protein [Rubrivivax sp.]|nr:SapC family protein [Rubrivivax sp.]MDH5338510.1 SapC family protein [Rubrivivax sp.]